MRFSASILPRAAAGIALGLALATAAAAQSPFKILAASVSHAEERLNGRVGIALVETDTGAAWFHRADEKFLMNSTMKTPVCGAVLARSDAGKLSLSEQLPVRESDLLSYAPVTKKHAGETMSIADLCLAALDWSDNTAANLLISRLGGPNEVTKFFRSIGDTVSRLDRYEPELNTFAAGSPLDTTTPAAMAETLRALLVGNALSVSSRNLLGKWMSYGSVTSTLLRKEAPANWEFFDKSGAGSHTRSIIALVTPEGSAPWIVAIYISDTDADFATRNAALKELGAAVIKVMRN
ncbi:class A beta-lactamase [Leisingera sp. ANG59]|uniref:class A beta-lactamase n=1 Tax=Leisingera sp. ANG59 TaxID=2675221 RepID=UPI001574939E|nr:class A beta-lactamase [Leisingera sp. ANG59]NSY37859.1 class A beta-lactamase [Leisingera sp. ANG59]